MASNHETHAAKLTTEKVNPQKHDKKVVNLGVGPVSEREESQLSSLPKERDAMKPTIISFFMKTPIKNETEKDTQKPAQGAKRERKSDGCNYQAGCEEVIA